MYPETHTHAHTGIVKVPGWYLEVVYLLPKKILIYQVLNVEDFCLLWWHFLDTTQPEARNFLGTRMDCLEATLDPC